MTHQVGEGDQILLLFTLQFNSKFQEQQKKKDSKVVYSLLNTF